MRNFHTFRLVTPVVDYRKLITLQHWSYLLHVVAHADDVVQHSHLLTVFNQLLGVDGFIKNQRSMQQTANTLHVTALSYFTTCYDSMQQCMHDLRLKAETGVLLNLTAAFSQIRKFKEKIKRKNRLE